MEGSFIINFNISVVIYKIISEELFIVVDFSEFFGDLEVRIVCLDFVNIIRDVVFFFGIFNWILMWEFELVWGDCLDFFYGCGYDNFDSVMLIVFCGNIVCYGF